MKWLFYFKHKVAFEIIIRIHSFLYWRKYTFEIQLETLSFFWSVGTEKMWNTIRCIAIISTITQKCKRRWFTAIVNLKSTEIYEFLYFVLKHPVLNKQRKCSTELKLFYCHAFFCQPIMYGIFFAIIKSVGNFLRTVALNMWHNSDEIVGNQWIHNLCLWINSHISEDNYRFAYLQNL